MNKQFKKACDIVGSQNKMAQKLGVSRQAVYAWLAGKVPVRRVIAIERLTGGKVTRNQLRPDIYPL